MKYSLEITEEICKYLRSGNNQHDSAVLAGISEETFYKWQRILDSDDKPNPEYHSEFSEAIKKAEKECKARNIALIQKAAETTWQAAAWYLERRYHDEYALKTVMEHTGDESKPLIIKIVAEIPLNERTRVTDQKLPQAAVNL